MPSPHNWRTTDEDEINRRRARARTEEFRISNTDPRHPIFSNFRVRSGSGLTYSVEIRDVRQRQFACDCVDFRINGLGTCKHVEAVLLQLAGALQAAVPGGGSRTARRGWTWCPTRRATRSGCSTATAACPAPCRAWFDADGALRKGLPEEAIEALKQLAADEAPALRLSQELGPWLEGRRRAAERKQLRRDYELKVQSGEWPAHETKVPLFPYQREGMLHLAFTERALLADEMGLGKTIQAIAACALLHRLGQAARVLVVTPASLKTEWEEQIQRFTDLPYQLVFGMRAKRLKAYEIAGGRKAGETPAPLPFFTIVNYEQMLADALEVNQRLRPDIVVLDEAQRIKNWSTKTTQAIKRLRSRYAFILTGTPIENRIDELYSLMDFLNPSLLGPLFRFNREYYDLDDRGRPAGYRNLDKLHERIKPHMLRRRKADVETELPERTDRNFFVPLSAEQQGEYDEPRGRRRPAGRHRQTPPAHPAGAGQAAAPSEHDAHGLRHQLHPQPRAPRLPEAGRAGEAPRRVPRQPRREGDRLLRMGADARTGARVCAAGSSSASPGTPARFPRSAAAPRSTPSSPTRSAASFSAPTRARRA